jgi:uncharacterized OB-fold protein
MMHDDRPLPVSRCAHCRHVIRLPTNYCPICKSEDPMGLRQPSDVSKAAVAIIVILSIAAAIALLVIVLLDLH